MNNKNKKTNRWPTKYLFVKLEAIKSRVSVFVMEMKNINETPIDTVLSKSCFYRRQALHERICQDSTKERQARQNKPTWENKRLNRLSRRYKQ